MSPIPQCMLVGIHERYVGILQNIWKGQDVTAAYTYLRRQDIERVEKLYGNTSYYNIGQMFISERTVMFQFGLQYHNCTMRPSQSILKAIHKVYALIAQEWAALDVPDFMMLKFETTRALIKAGKIVLNEANKVFFDEFTTIFEARVEEHTVMNEMPIIEAMRYLLLEDTPKIVLAPRFHLKAKK